MTLTLRPLRAEDSRDAARIFFCAVHDGTRHAYTLQEGPATASTCRAGRPASPP